MTIQGISISFTSSGKTNLARTRPRSYYLFLYFAASDKTRKRFTLEYVWHTRILKFHEFMYFSLILFSQSHFDWHCHVTSSLNSIAIVSVYCFKWQIWQWNKGDLHAVMYMFLIIIRPILAQYKQKELVPQSIPQPQYCTVIEWGYVKQKCHDSLYKKAEVWLECTLSLKKFSNYAN